MTGELKTYEVHFELFGIKMKTSVIAQSEDAARLMVFSKIKFHKIEPKENPDLNDLSKEMFEKLKEVFK